MTVARVLEVAAIVENKEAVSRRILSALPQWFGIREAKEAYIRAACDLPMFACRADGKIVGFLTLRVHNEFAAELHSMGILPQWHRRGFGTRLVNHAERYAREKGIRFLSVKTLAPSKADESYGSTRQFYRAIGFVPLEELPDLWGPDNPCLMMIKCVADSRGP